MKFAERIRKEVMILNGSMGVLMQSEGMPGGYAPDLWAIENPDKVIKMHRRYVDAGSQIIITDTFGATAPRLEEYGRGSDVKMVNHKAVENARKGADGRALVAGDIGPSGKLIVPLGELAFEEAVGIFKEQISALLEAGVDLLIIETMFDLMEMKAALVAANEVRKNTPVIACMTYTADGITDTGATPEAAAAVIEGLGADVVGLNCSTGPKEMVDVVQRLADATSLPICVQPNAGLPVIEAGKTVYKESSETLAEYAEKFVEVGANIVGGCCGTKPDYIEKISKTIKGAPPVPRPANSGVVIASRSRIARIGEGHPFLKIGEKINPTGKKKFAAAIKEGRTDLILMDARKQTESGAMALDVNVGVPLTDEAAMMQKAVIAIQNVTPLPLVIDSSFDSALEAGLAVYSGRALVNSVNAEPEKLESVLPMIKRMGAAVIALTAGEEVPESADKRFEYAKQILKRAEALGLSKDDIVFDCLAVVVSAMQEGARQTLLTIRRIREELGCATVVGLSNTSFGLPDRKSINNAFLAMAMAEGLDGAIVNPYDDGMHKVAVAASLFTRRDPGCKRYIDAVGKIEDDKEKKPAHKKQKPLKERIFDAVLEGEKDSIQSLIKAGLDEEIKPMEMFADSLTPAIRKMGELFAERKKFIPHLVAAADTMKKGMEILTPLLLESQSVEKKGTIVFATVKGDVHDIGKNVCCIMLQNFGFDVIDLGRSVPMEDILESAEKNCADVIALSALMTTTMIQMKTVIDEVKKRGLSCKVMVGGAVLTRGYAKEIGAHAYGKDVGDVVQTAENLLAVK